MTTLKKGCRGDEVKALQELLRKAGYNLVVDSDFGQKTFAAVVAFQKSKGLVADGIVGDRTWEALGVKGDSKSVDPSVLYLPISVHITKSPGRNIKYLIIHYTAGSSSAQGCVRAIKNVFEKRQASADFAVDDKEMAQYNPDIRNYYTWAVSGGNGITNKNSISIEMCSSLKKGTTASTPNHEGWYFTEATLDNTVKLAKILMKKFNIPIERVVRHFDVTGKLCPGVVGWNNGVLYTEKGRPTKERNNSSEWLKFKERLK